MAHIFEIDLICWPEVDQGQVSLKHYNMPPAISAVKYFLELK